MTSPEPAGSPPPTAARDRWLRPVSAGLAAWIALILVVCLIPARSEPPKGLCLFCGEQGTASFVLNIVLYAPLGFGVAFRWRRVGHAVVAALVLSAGVELAQLFIPGRHSTPSDLLANGLGGWWGGALGAHLGAWMLPDRGTARRLSLAAATGVALVLAATAVLPVPTVLQDSPLFGQWTPVLPSFQIYRGTLLDASVGGVRVPHGLLEGEAVREALARDSLAVSLRFLVGPPQPGLAPVLRLVDGEGREALQVGVDRNALVLRYRYLADEVRFARPDLRWTGWDAGLEVGDTAVVHLVRSPAGETTLVVGSGPPTTRGIGVEQGWAFLRPLPWLPTWTSSLLGGLWIAALAGPLGWWAESFRAAAARGAALALVLAALPIWTPLVASTPAVGLAALSATLLGSVGARRCGVRSREPW